MKMCLTNLAVTLVLVSLVSGCGSFIVDSQPSGAQIIINNREMRQRTPCRYYPKHFVAGNYVVTVKKDGYEMLSEP
ncbi:MAG: PEGA domain-containing protein, partial [Pontiellaceae bacterium]|nr:PEGA domain-containing protein [Pontiellaceae bacterium]